MKILLSKRLIFVFFISFFYNLNSVRAQDSAQLRSVLTEMLTNELRLDSTALTGFVIGVMDGDSTFCFGFGRVSKIDNRPPSRQTSFEIGGLTHVFTASAVEWLAAEGKIDLDAPILNYLPQDFQFPMAAQISTRQLMSHTSGLPKIPDNLGDEERDIAQPYADYSFQNLFDFLKNLNPKSPEKQLLQAEKYLFSHINFAILEKIIETASGKSYKNFMENNWKRRFMPPPSIGTFLGEKPSDWTLAQGYNLAARPTPARTYASFESALGFRSCADDLLFFMRNQLTDNILQKTQRIEATTILDKNTKIAHGWHVIQKKRNLQIVGQSGSTGGTAAAVFFVPRTRTGVVMLGNSKAGLNRIAFMVLQILNNDWKRKKA